MTFNQFLDERNLPPVGAIITTPSGFKVKVLHYLFFAYGARVRISTVNERVELFWDFDTVRKCDWEGKRK